LIDTYVVDMTRRTDIFGTVREICWLFQGDMTKGPHWLGRRQCRLHAGSKVDFKICVRAALYDQSNWKCLQSTEIHTWHVICETKYYS